MPAIAKYVTILYAGLIVLWVRVLLMVKTLPQVLTIMTTSTSRRGCRPGSFEDVVYYVDRWLSLFPYNAKGNCFPRSVALYWLARWAGHSVQFCCGVRKIDGRLDGHAWLMSNGRPFHEPTLHWKEFTVTFAFPIRASSAPSRPASSSADHPAAASTGWNL